MLSTLEFDVFDPQNLWKIVKFFQCSPLERMWSFIFRDLLEGPWKVYENSFGRIFYHNSELKKSSWKPPRKYKPARTRVLSEEDQDGSASNSGVHDVIIPMGFVELHDKTSGINFPIARHWVTSLFQEKSFMKTSRVGIDGSRPWTRRVDSTFTALTLTPWKPGQSGLCPLSTHQHWTRSISSHTLECEWNPKLLQYQYAELETGGNNPLDNRKVVREGLLSWRLKQDKKWSYSCVVIFRWFK